MEAKKAEKHPDYWFWRLIYGSLREELDLTYRLLGILLRHEISTTEYERMRAVLMSETSRNEDLGNRNRHEYSLQHASTVRSNDTLSLTGNGIYFIVFSW